MGENDSPRPDPDVAEYVFPALQKSGFPFQATVVDITRSNGRWRVEDEEVPWRDDSGRDQFLDLAARNRRCVITVECKKTEREIYTFLLRSLTRDGQAVPMNTRGARCIHLDQIDDSTQRLEVFCADWWLRPNVP